MFWRIVLCAGTQAVSLQQSAASQRFVLAPAVTTTFVRIEVTSVYTSCNNGAKEICFEGAPAPATTGIMPSFAASASSPP